MHFYSDLKKSKRKAKAKTTKDRAVSIDVDSTVRAVSQDVDSTVRADVDSAVRADVDSAVSPVSPDVNDGG